MIEDMAKFAFPLPPDFLYRPFIVKKVNDIFACAWILQVFHQLHFNEKEFSAKMKQNCWEAKKCGREPGGDNVGEFGICPAVTETKLDGIHSGKNGGRACWVITGTYCKGDIQGAFIKKFAGCVNCDFYSQVQSEEHPDVMLSVDLLKKLVKSEES